MGLPLPVFIRVRIHRQDTGQPLHALLLLRELFRFPAALFVIAAREASASLIGRQAHQKLFIEVHHLLRLALGELVALIEEDHPVTVSGNGSQIVADEQDRLALGTEFFKFMIAFCLKENIPDGQGLIDNQDFRVDVNGHGKCQAHEHTARVGLYRLVDKLADIRKGENAVHPLLNFLLRESHHSPVQVDVFDPCIFHIEAGTQLKQSGNAPVGRHGPFRRGKHTGDNLQDCRFS